MKKYENYVSHLRVLRRADQEELLAYEGSSAAAAGSPRGIIKEVYAHILKTM